MIMVTASMKLTREQAANRAVGGVRVKPANEANRVHIRHPSGIRFRAGVDDAVEWPNDAFTKRRISDGSVVLAGPRVVTEVVMEPPVTKQPAPSKKVGPAE
jgi:hypothetical protein